MYSFMQLNDVLGYVLSIARCLAHDFGDLTLALDKVRPRTMRGVLKRKCFRVLVLPT